MAIFANVSSKRPAILVLASTFPRWKRDSEPPFVYELSSRLAAQCDVTVLAPRSVGAAMDEIWENRLRIVRYPYFFPRFERLAYQGGILAKLKSDRRFFLLVPFFLLGQLLAVMALCRKQHFDVIHAHWIFPQAFLALLATRVLQQSIPVVVTAHGGDLYGLRGRLLSRIKRWVLLKASGVTVVSHAMRRDVAAMTDNQVDSQVLSMGVALRNVFTPPLPQDMRDRYRILFVGRLVEKKGVDVLLRALPIVRENFPAVHVTIVGDGPERSCLESLAQELGVVEVVEFAGRKPNAEIVDFYRSAGVFAMPSIIAADGDQEGLGLVAVEAMGCGCPVIASDLAAIQDVVSDGVTGILFRAGDHEALAAALLKLFDDQVLADSLAVSARQYVIDRYDWDIVAERYSQVLTMAANGDR